MGMSNDNKLTVVMTTEEIEETESALGQDGTVVMTTEEKEETESALGQDETGRNYDKYRDKFCVLCSVRWRMCILLFLLLKLLYMHRVNISLAVVCMVDTSGSTSHGHTTTGSSDLEDSNNASWTSYVIPEERNNTHNVSLNQLNVNNRAEQKEKEFKYDIDWSKSDISFLLSSYFYGSFFTQVPAGRLADYFGGKHIITVTMIVSSACAFLTPICAKYSLALMFVLRIVIGLAGGAVIPVAVAILGVWAPPMERPAMMALSMSGASMGTTLTYWTSGVLCKEGFAGGWPSIFYIHGAITVVFVIVWMFEASSSPGEHPRIDRRELAYIQQSIPHSDVKRSKKTPWLAMALSRPLWAVFAAHFAYNWSFFAILINIPLFMKEVLNFSIEQNGLYSSLPYVFLLMTTLISSNMSTFIIKRHILPHLAARKIFTAFSFIGSSVCLTLCGTVDRSSRHVAVILLCLACVFKGFMFGGMFANHAEFSGRYTGTVFGITNAGGVISALLSSLTAGLLTPNGERSEWQNVFYVAAAINLVGMIMFITCSSVVLETWASNKTTIEIFVDEQGRLTEAGEKSKT